MGAASSSIAVRRASPPVGEADNDNKVGLVGVRARPGVEIIIQATADRARIAHPSQAPTLRDAGLGFPASLKPCEPGLLSLLHVHKDVDVIALALAVLTHPDIGERPALIAHPVAYEFEVSADRPDGVWNARALKMNCREPVQSGADRARTVNSVNDPADRPCREIY